MGQMCSLSGTVIWLDLLVSPVRTLLYHHHPRAASPPIHYYHQFMAFAGGSRHGQGSHEEAWSVGDSEEGQLYDYDYDDDESYDGTTAAGAGTGIGVVALSQGQQPQFAGTVIPQPQVVMGVAIADDNTAQLFRRVIRISIAMTVTHTSTARRPEQDTHGTRVALFRCLSSWNKLCMHCGYKPHHLRSSSLSLLRCSFQAAATLAPKARNAD